MAHHKVYASYDPDSGKGTLSKDPLVVGINDTVHWLPDNKTVESISAIFLETSNLGVFSPVPKYENNFKGTIVNAGGYKNNEWYFITVMTPNGKRVKIDPKIAINPPSGGGPDMD